MAARTICGYAAVFYKPDDVGTVGIADDNLTQLRAMPGAFDKALELGECHAWYSHRDGRDLGGIDDGNLVLGVDAAGLWYRLRPNNGDGRKVAKRIERGRLSGSSWQGHVTDSFAYTSGSGVRVCEFRTIDLIEVGPCTVPTFAAATCWLEDDEAAWGDDANRIARTLSRMRLEDSH